MARDKRPFRSSAPAHPPAPIARDLATQAIEDDAIIAAEAPTAAPKRTPAEFSVAEVLEALTPCLREGDSFEAVTVVIGDGRDTVMASRVPLRWLGNALAWRARTSYGVDIFLHDDWTITTNGVPVETTDANGRAMVFGTYGTWDPEAVTDAKTGKVEGRFAHYVAHPTKSDEAIRLLVPKTPAGYDHSMRSYFVERRIVPPTATREEVEAAAALIKGEVAYDDAPKASAIERMKVSK